MPVNAETLRELLPLVVAWAAAHETRIRADGVRLTRAQCADARAVGVRRPRRVRLLRVARIPVPEEPLLAEAAHATGLLGPDTAGLTLRYGIYVRADAWNDRRLVAHELAHTAQYERFGGLAAFLEQYLLECITVGYAGAPLEQEAVRMESCVGDR